MSERITQEQIEQLVSKYPKLLLIIDSLDVYTRKTVAIQCGSGWLDLINATLYSIQKYIDFCNRYTDNPVDQIKVHTISERAGSIRFYYYGIPNDVIDSKLDLAAEVSKTICEISGNAGKTYAKNGWYKTLSKDLADMLGYEEDTYLIGDSSGADPTTVTGA